MEYEIRGGKRGGRCDQGKEQKKMVEMKKLYISCPMKGRTEEDIRKSMEKMHRIAEIIFDEPLEVIQTYVEDLPPEEAREAVWYLGWCIQLLSEADYFIGVSGSYAYNGCEIEKEIARRYDIPRAEVNILEIAPDCKETLESAIGTGLALGYGFGGR